MQSLNRLSAPSDAATGPYVWSDANEADVAQDIANLQQNNFANEQAAYQQQFALGKLASVSAVRSLHAAQSIDAAPVASLRQWLSRHDRMTTAQPALDNVLSELGVTHRLVRRRLPGKSAEFHWQPVEHARPLCQLFSDDRSSNTVAQSVSWNWHDSDSLQVGLPDAPQTSATIPRLLLIRQLNDGGWDARTETGQALQLDPGSLFVIVHLRGSERQVQLTRKWLW